MGKTYKIAVMPGDGTGPEVVAEGLKALQAAAAKHKFALDLTHYDFGGGLQDLESLNYHLGPGAIARHHRDLVRLHHGSSL